MSSRIKRWLQRLILGEQGAAAIELAIILPLMVLLMLASIELYLYVRAISEVEHTAFTVADVLGQADNIIDDKSTSASNNLGSIFADAALLAAPLSLQTQGSVFITSICDATTTPCGSAIPTNSTAKGTPAIYWQRTSPWNNSAMLASNETASSLLPASWPFRNGDSAIVVEVAYTYNPFPMTQSLWAKAPGTTTLYKRVYVRARSGTPLALVAAP